MTNYSSIKIHQIGSERWKWKLGKVSSWFGGSWDIFCLVASFQSFAELLIDSASAKERAAGNSTKLWGAEALWYLPSSSSGKRQETRLEFLTHSNKNSKNYYPSAIFSKYIHIALQPKHSFFRSFCWYDHYWNVNLELSDDAEDTVTNERQLEVVASGHLETKHITALLSVLLWETLIFSTGKREIWLTLQI